MPNGDLPITLTSGPGWGDGSHETTKLCLQAIRIFHPGTAIRALDFGSGSGILSIALARRGGTVDAVEIEEAAIETSRENARLNQLEDRIRFSRGIESASAHYDWVIANILRPVLVEFAGELTRVLKPGGTLVLSGIVATDLPVLTVRYSPLLQGRAPDVYRQGEWCCLVWR
jgi:ribosomal protein L11 methyltransferase